MSQDDAALADVVKTLSEQLHQVQWQFRSQLAEQQVTIAEQKAVNAEQARQIDALTSKVTRLAAEQKVIAAIRDIGTSSEYLILSIYLGLSGTWF